MGQETDKASEEIKDHYSVVGVVPGEVILNNGEKVDLRTISLEKAKELFDNGFPFLRAKKKPKDPSGDAPKP